MNVKDILVAMEGSFVVIDKETGKIVSATYAWKADADRAAARMGDGFEVVEK